MRTLLPLLAAAGFMFFLQPFSLAGRASDGLEHPSLARPANCQPKKEKGKFDPPEAFQPTEKELAQIKAKTAQLAAKIAELRANGQRKLSGGAYLTHDLLSDVEIYLRGAQNIVRFKEFYNKDSVKWTFAALDRGLERADELAKGKMPWRFSPLSNVAFAYRSKIDGTAQPYGVTYPLDYEKDVKRVWRLDIVLHGRNASLTEVAFLQQHSGTKKPAADQDWVQIDIFGRGNNAYRWAGETDVHEALEAFLDNLPQFGQDGMIDRRRIVMRGFSMGGAGTWHLGLHHPDKWCVMGPGAGFTTTHGYASKQLVPDALPDYQEKCLRIYDAVDYVENARMIPIVAYSGGDDPQKKAADNIENRLKELNIDAMTHLVAPGVGHSFVPEYFKKANALWSAHAKKGRPQYPASVSYVTYSLLYNQCDWVKIHGIEKHYEKATVSANWDGKSHRITTRNVTTLEIEMPWYKENRQIVPISIDDQKFTAVTESQLRLIGRYQTQFLNYVILWRDKGTWKCPSVLEYPVVFPQTKKRPGRQGPIDDAFASGFVCVEGTGKTWHPATQKFVDARLKAFEYDWAKHMRGELPITNEYGITPNEIMNKNLILFGDPSSNFLLANILPKLPLKWTKDEIEFAGQKYKSSEHVPVMIFPNPLNPVKYVVLNTGHTWPSEAYTQTNAMLFPRLGDYAILRMADSSVATAGLFDEFWRVEKK